MGSSDEALAPLVGVIESLTGREPDRVQMTQFQRYLDLLLLWNRTHRLTGPRTLEGIVRELFEDSLLFLAPLPPGRVTMVDLGAGAGIPGVPLRLIRPELILTAIDSRRKCASFLSALKRELDLGDMEVLEGRAERLVVQVQALAGAFDVAVTRAVGASLIPTAMQYLKPGGVLIAGSPPTPRMEAFPRGSWSVKGEKFTFPELRLSRTFIIGRKLA